MKKTDPDVLVANEGTIFLFSPLSHAAREWIDEHLEAESQWFGAALVVEHRFDIRTCTRAKRRGVCAGIGEATMAKRKVFVFGVVTNGDESNLVLIPEPEAKRLSAIYRAISSKTWESSGD